MMTPEEHSRMLYLMDALIAAPDKKEKLFKIADKEIVSNRYKEVLKQLKETEELEQTIKRIREEML